MSSSPSAISSFISFSVLKAIFNTFIAGAVLFHRSVVVLLEGTRKGDWRAGLSVVSFVAFAQRYDAVRGGFTWSKSNV